MRTLTTMLTVGCLLSTPLAFAQDPQEDHSAHHPPAAAAPDANAPAAQDHGDAKANPLQEKMKQVESLMQQIQQASDPAQKRELMSQHLAALREQMRLIRGQRSDMKMSMKEDGKKDTMGGMKEGGMMKGGGMMMMMHKKVEQRLEMLERLMEQIIEREAAEESMR